jgi:hypothetical protein
MRYPSNTKKIIMDIKTCLLQYGCQPNTHPHYTIIGRYRNKTSLQMGILACANNEFYAHILKREINKFGECSIERTEYHPDGATFSLKLYAQELKALKNNAAKEIINAN